MLTLAVSTLALMAAEACGPSAPTLVESWQITGLQNPESIIAVGDGSYFVSNVSGGAADRNGEGFISRLWMSGGVNAYRWASRLDAPKGLAIANGHLFVTDIDALIEFDIETGRRIARHPVEGAQFLNDAASLPDGRILVSDSQTRRIHVLDHGNVSVWMESDRFGGLSGLLVETDRLLVTTMSEGLVLAIDWESQAITELASGLVNADGIDRWCEGYLISQWPGQIAYLTASGHVHHLLDTREDGIAMNDFIVDGNRLMIPNWTPGSVRTYQLAPALY